MTATVRISLVSIALSLALWGCDDGPSSAEPDAADAVAADVMPPDAADARPDAASAPPADHPFFRGGPLVIAHRGGRRLGPECTLATYEMAWAAGADALEADVHLTADGVVVVMHDHEVDRTTDGSGAIAELTLAEIKALDAAYAYGPNEGFPYRGMGLTVPTLAELLAAFPEAPFSLEIKQDEPPMIDALVDVLDAHDARGRVLVAAYTDQTITRFRAAAPDVPTALGVGEVIGWISLPPGEGTDDWQPPGHFLQVPLAQAGFELVTAATVPHAQRNGVRLHPYTINEPDEMRLMIELGVDGVITDDPVAWRALLDGR